VGAAAAVALASPVFLLVNSIDRRWMDDDGFINLRIVRNWIHGDGPVFNVGERVEAATSPLWLGLLALFGELRIPLEQGAVFAGIAFTVLALLIAQQASGALHRERSDLREPSLFPGLPLGALVFAAVPAAWDYASSGLETGLGLVWLAGSYLALVRSRDRTSTAWTAATASLLGLGPLIRPEFALYSGGFLITLAVILRSSERRWTLSRVVAIVLSAAAAPLAFEFVRMGYYGAIVPNTAIAKEAFAGNWGQGSCYFNNFFRTYALVWPLVAAGVIWILDLRADASRHRWVTLTTTLVPPVAATLHAVFIVAIGGDYMHARLFIPAVFAGVLPVATVPINALGWGLRRSIAVVAMGVVVVWAPVCALTLRVGVENVCNIGDERGWYAREAHVANPVELAAYRGHMFYAGAQSAWDALRRECPSLSLQPSVSSHSHCRRVMVDDEQQKEIAPSAASYPESSQLDSRVDAVTKAGAIGIFGYFFPSNVDVIDLHGLAEPIVARFELLQRGRPGHEKRLTAAWMLARFAEPDPDEDAAVSAARHALHCGALASLERAITSPLTFQRVIDNIQNAWSLSRIRIPPDPFDAESHFCGTDEMPTMTTSGSGGNAFRWACPARHTLRGLRGDVDSKEGALSHIQAVCGSADARGAQADGVVVGPAFGEGKDVSFELACPPDSTVVGFHGRADRLVRSVGLVCRGPVGDTQTSQGGREVGTPFTLRCPKGSVPGLSGRSGALIDAIGPICSP
jgi:arabinofuranosyltransferase